MLAAKRLLQRGSLFAALAGVSAIVTGLAVGLTGYVAEAEDAGARLEVASRTGSAAALDASLDLVDDSDDQDAAMRRVLSSLLRSNGSPIAVDVTRTTATESLVAFTQHAGAVQRAQFSTVEGLEDVASLVEGSWPTTPGDATVQADAADILELGVGDTIDVEGTSLTITGTWRVDDPIDPRWFANPLVTTGFDETRAGPIVVAEPTIAAIGGTVRVHWTIVPDAQRISASDLSSVIGAWQQLGRAVRAEGTLDGATLDASGGLARTATQFEKRANALRAVEPIAMLTVAAVAVISVVELARLLAGLRSAETLLLWSRGSRSRRLVIVSVIEAGLVAAVGAALGVVAALAIGRGSSMVVAAPLAVVGLVVVTIGVTTATGIRGLSRNELPTDSDRARRIGGLGLVALLCLAAVIAVWQLLRYGSPISTPPSGRPQVDPLAVLAPSLALVALVLLASLALPVLARVAERRAAVSTGYSRVLAARTLARRRSAALTPFVLCALAFGQLVIAAGYAQTWSDSYTAAQQLRSGSELRVTAGPRVLSPAVLDSIDAADGVTGFAPVIDYPVSISALSGQLVAVSPTALEALAVSTAVDAGALAEAIAIDAPGPTLPVGASDIRIDVTTTGLDAPPAATALLSSPWGGLHSLALVADATGYSGDLPPADYSPEQGWQLVALDVKLPPTTEVQSLSVTEITADGAPVDLGAEWTAIALASQPFPISSSGDVGFRSVGEATSVRLVPAYRDDPNAATVFEAPIVMSASLASATGIEVGDSFRISLDPRVDEVQVVVAAIAPAVPGSAADTALLIDASIVQAVQLRSYAVPPTPSQLWVSSSNAASSALALRSVLPAGAVVESAASDPARGVLASASVALWIGAAGTGILAIVALGAVIGGQLRSRRSEVVVLRAMGVGARSQARMRWGELAVVLAAGALAGLVAGGLVTLLVVPPLARAAVPLAYDSIPTPVAVAIGALGLAVVALGAGLSIVSGSYGAAVQRQARTASAREDAL